MKTLSQQNFLKTLPDVLIPHLPPKLQKIQVHQPWRWLIQFHFGELYSPHPQGKPKKKRPIHQKIFRCGEWV